MRHATFKEASVHGRFQPFHLEHLEYVLAAVERCDFLWIGITQYDIRTLRNTPGANHRGMMVSNPLTFYERAEMITGALLEKNIDRGAFGFIPFPIEDMAILCDYTPITIPCLTTICDEWNRRKIDMLKSAGYRVEVLFERNKKECSGLEIRKLIMRRDDGWKSMVPPSTVRVVERLDLSVRLERLQKESQTDGASDLGP